METHKTIPIESVLLKIHSQGSDPGKPKIEGHKCITLQEIELEGNIYHKYEYVPEHIDLCTGGNAKRKGDVIEMV